MNLTAILEERQKKILKAKGIIIHSNMSEDELTKFERDIWETDIPLEIIKDILDTIDENM